MNITIFQSEKGDCLLLTSAQGHNILVDGGMRASFSEHVSKTLSGLKRIDVVYVSHIDRDHISGILQLMDDTVAWRVHDFHKKNGESVKAPRSHHPPDIKAIYHNAFHEQVGKNAEEIADLLAATASILYGSDFKSIREAAETRQDLATSIDEAIQLSRRVGAAQLGIPLNSPAKGKLMFARNGNSPIKFGSLSLRIIGPFEEDLTTLRKEWNDWLIDNKAKLEKIEERAKKDEKKLLFEESTQVLVNAKMQADSLANDLDLPLKAKKGKKVLGQRKKVTAPNLASLMFFVEEKGKTCLLTGDGHSDDILKGLKRINKLDASGNIHVDVLKVQHHGSEHNIEQNFARAVTANHYVFCGNGEHENPDLDVVDLIANTRLSNDNGKFKFWFNSSSSVTQAKPQAHMKELEKRVRNHAKKSNGRMSFKFLSGSKMLLSP